MKTGIKMVLIAAACCVLLIGVAISNQKIDRWEYRLESLEDLTFQTQMNAIGADGWELIFARRAMAGEEKATRGVYECIFKRRKPSGAAEFIGLREIPVK